jgi:multidrug resistance efflux pump
VRRELLVAAALSTALVTGCAKPNSDADQPPAPAVPVRLATLTYGPLSTPIEVSGSVTAVHAATVGAVSPGRIVAVYVRAGDAVRAGEVIARVDSRGYAAGVEQAQAGALAAGASQSAAESAVAAAVAAAGGARAQLDGATAKAALAETTTARMTSLFDQGAISKQQRDEAVTALASARADLTQAHAGLDAALGNVASARARLRAAAASAEGAQASVRVADVPLGDASITAPFDGVVTAKYVEPGAVVAPGSPVAAVQDDRSLEVDVAVPDEAIAAVVPGAPVDVRVDAAGSTVVHGRVRAVVPAQDAALRSASATIDIPSAPGVKPGMYARVAFVTRTRAGWTAPLAALVTRAGQSGVFVVRDGAATFVPLQTGAVGNGSVELLGYNGPAARVVVGGIERVGDGSRVAVER